MLLRLLIMEPKPPNLKRGERLLRLFYPSGAIDLSFKSLDNLPALFEGNPRPDEEL